VTYSCMSDTHTTIGAERFSLPSSEWIGGSRSL